ncbi:hypothetical protein DVW08_05800 [Clostridium botulinum]|nr:hypothetical protein [Clostridium botulinum]
MKIKEGMRLYHINKEENNIYYFSYNKNIITLTEEQLQDLRLENEYKAKRKNGNNIKWEDFVIKESEDIYQAYRMFGF